MASHISLKQLKVFTTITQHKTLTSASDSLFLSKAAVSMALSELEKQIGHHLFDRVNNRLILNQEGQKLLPLADELLNRAKDIESIFDGDQALSGQLRIGASDTIGNQVAPYLLSEFRQQTNHRSQSLFISNSAQICDMLTDYELDIALIEGKTLHPELQSTQFSEDEMCVICAPDYPAAHEGPVNLTELENSEWILREAGSGSREFFMRVVAPRLEHWHEAFQLNTTEALINSVSAGLGLGCLSRLSAEPAIRDGRVKLLDMPLDMKRRFWLLVHKEKYQSPLLKTFIEFCQDWERPTNLPLGNKSAK
ncbi:LysR substrate-binding domain-containing protein [Vibrio parahaemolyticus]|uniref:LysR substrate-binding domain-containing protein n=1 Tax=Vibrio parahaemolyticus TaxID=670 RepID=UPI00040891F2|nr:LysR substrate-binding domain-containing protein [Vibrio parahaemolyticus]EGQ8920905.1 LysR family transcriptional regulator [Vibrio parahaemolyticus]MBE5190187.1 LysR family transcriptional regulator [Vibrio parahaemolyticus]MCG9646129.1 LysR substrate-binding domain-containing protein [Vibrio parahaemolyticus]TON02346.1 LysR family transcriptional regulator [Vibrio parahaemolyticus]HCH4310823.1 LysR family transcriptional regulator [Vibrio parahaemolyticus]